MLLGELPALTLEFTRLTQITGDEKFFDAVQRITDVLSRQQNQTRLPGLWPLSVDAEKQDFSYQNGFTLGWMAEGAYNYLATVSTFLLASGLRISHSSQGPSNISSFQAARVKYQKCIDQL